MIDTDSTITTNQHNQSSFVSLSMSDKPVVAISVSKPKPTTSDRLKNLFLNGLLLKQFSFVRAVNI